MQEIARLMDGYAAYYHIHKYGQSSFKNRCVHSTHVYDGELKFTALNFAILFSFFSRSNPVLLTHHICDWVWCFFCNTRFENDFHQQKQQQQKVSPKNLR